MILSIFASVLCTAQALATEPPPDLTVVSPQDTSNIGSTGNPGSLVTNIGFLSYLYNDNTNPSQMAGMELSFLGKYRFDDRLTGSFEIGLQVETGNSQVVYNNDYLPKQAFYLTEAALNFQVTDGVLLRAGAFDQGKFENPLLFMSTISFPGVQQAFSLYSSSSSEFQLQAEEAIPSSTMTTPIPTQNQGMPSFLAAGVQWKFGKASADLVSGSVHVRYFSFSNLPAIVAQESGLRGNSVSGIGADGAQFLYGYQGVESAANFKLNLSPDFRPFVQAAGITNLDAPAGLNQGFLTGVGSEIRVSPKVIFTPAIQYFRIESDVAPAFYNDRAYGHTNYQGLALSTQVSLPRSELTATVSWASASVLQDNPYQSNFNLITIQLGKSYALY